MHIINWIEFIYHILLLPLALSILAGLVVVRAVSGVKRQHSLFDTRLITPWPATLYVVSICCFYIVANLTTLVLEAKVPKDQTARSENIKIIVLGCWDMLVQYPLLFMAAVSALFQLLQIVMLKQLLERFKANFVSQTKSFRLHAQKLKSAERKIKILRFVSSKPFISSIVLVFFAVYLLAAVLVVALGVPGVLDYSTGQSVLTMIANVIVAAMVILGDIIMVLDALITFIMFVRAERGRKDSKLTLRESLRRAWNWFVDRPHYRRIELSIAFILGPLLLIFIIGDACQCFVEQTNKIALYLLFLTVLFFPGGGVVVLATIAQTIGLRRVKSRIARLARNKSKKRQTKTDGKQEEDGSPQEERSEASSGNRSTASSLANIEQDFDSFVRTLVKNQSSPMCKEFQIFCKKEFSIENWICIVELLSLQDRLRQGQQASPVSVADSATGSTTPSPSDALVEEGTVSVIHEWNRIKSTFVQRNSVLEVNLEAKLQQEVLAADASANNNALLTISERLLRAVMSNLFDTFHRFALNDDVLHLAIN